MLNPCESQGIRKAENIVDNEQIEIQNVSIRDRYVMVKNIVMNLEVVMAEISYNI